MDNKVEIKVTGTPSGIKELLDAIGGKEQLQLLNRIYKNTEPLTKESFTKGNHATK